MSEIRDIVRDLAKRTWRNYCFIEEQVKANSQSDLYEVTQLINSFIGLVIIPTEREVGRIPTDSLAELEANGWPHIQILHGEHKSPNLRQLARRFRNAIAHAHIEFESFDQSISHVVLWDEDPDSHTEIWRARLHVGKLRDFVKHFATLFATLE